MPAVRSGYAAGLHPSETLTGSLWRLISRHVPTAIRSTYHVGFVGRSGTAPSQRRIRDSGHPECLSGWFRIRPIADSQHPIFDPQVLTVRFPGRCRPNMAIPHVPDRFQTRGAKPQPFARHRPRQLPAQTVDPSRAPMATSGQSRPRAHALDQWGLTPPLAEREC